MVKTYEECFEELIEKSEEWIEEDDSKEDWIMIVSEIVGEKVLDEYDLETIDNINSRIKPDKTWTNICRDINDHIQVRRHMAYRAIEIKIIDELEDEYR